MDIQTIQQTSIHALCPGEGLKIHLLFFFGRGGGGEGTGVVHRYLISSRDKSWGVGRKEPKEGANLWGCAGAAAALATDAQRDPAHMPRGPVGSRARHKAAGCAPNSLPSPEEGPGATVGKARATARPPSSQPPGWGTTLSSRAGSLGTCFFAGEKGTGHFSKTHTMQHHQ